MDLLVSLRRSSEVLRKLIKAVTELLELQVRHDRAGFGSVQTFFSRNVASRSQQCFTDNLKKLIRWREIFLCIRFAFLSSENWSECAQQKRRASRFEVAQPTFLSISASPSSLQTFSLQNSFSLAPNFPFLFRLSRLSLFFFLSGSVLNRFSPPSKHNSEESRRWRFCQSGSFASWRIFFVHIETVQLNLPDKELQSTAEFFEPKNQMLRF